MQHWRDDYVRVKVERATYRTCSQSFMQQIKAPPTGKLAPIKQSSVATRAPASCATLGLLPCIRSAQMSVVKHSGQVEH